MDVKKFFRRLDKARKARNDSVQAACSKIGISRPTWYVWANGGGKDGPLEVYIERAERYIDGD